MANEQLDSFLASEAQAATAEPAPPQPSEAPPAAATDGGGAKDPPATKVTTTPPEDDDGPPPKPLDGEDAVPFRAFEDERRKRNDWKEKAARLEGELAAYKRQQEEAQRPQPQPVYQQPAPDPAADPYGYARYVNLQNAQQQLNHQLNTSEMLLREKIGDDKVTEYVNEFKQLAARDQSLYPKLYSQPHPYAWMQREVERQRVLRDVGDDPSAYRSRIEAEARAKWEAEAKAAVPVSPAAGQQPSLATTRSVAGRTAGTWTGEPSLEDVLSVVQNRKRPNGDGRGPVRY
jgi:hypothetical protein